MLAEPDKLYGRDIGSNYQGQVETLGKHFKRPEARPARGPRRTAGPTAQSDLFG